MFYPKEGETKLNVKVHLSLMGLAEVNILSSTLKASVMLAVYWHDNRLKWDPLN